MSAVNTIAYTRSHTAAYVSDNMRTLVKILIRYHGLDPEKVADAWTSWVDGAARAWLQSGDLRSISVEFYYPGSSSAVARWDFPIRYDGDGLDEMWMDRGFLEDSFAKAKAPPADCSYRIVLTVSPDAPHVAGTGDTEFRSIDGLTGREIGTVIATPDIMASARYYR